MHRQSQTSGVRLHIGEFRDSGCARFARGDQRNFIALDQPSGLLHGFWRRVAVIERNQIDLAAVDAAALIEHPEIADLTLAERAERRTGPLRHGLAYSEFGRGDTAHFGAERGRRPGQHGKRAPHGKFLDETHRGSLPFIPDRSTGGRDRRSCPRSRLR
jgi:hypothetical protein